MDLHRIRHLAPILIAVATTAEAGTSVEDFGMIGNGAYDNYAEWETAISTMDDEDCPVLEVPAGTYLIGTDRDTYQTQDCLVIQGEGIGSILDFQGDTDVVFDGFASGARLILRHLLIRNNDQGIVLFSGSGQADRLVVNGVRFEDITPSSDSRCIIDFLSNATAGYDLLKFTDNEVHDSKCAIQVQGVPFGTTEVRGNHISSLSGALGFTFGATGSSGQGPISMVHNTFRDCTSDTNSDVALLRSLADGPTTISFNQAVNCTNPSGEFEGLVHVQGVSDSLSVVGNVGIDLGIGAATCSAALVNLKGYAGEAVAANNVLHQSESNDCTGFNISVGGAIVKDNLVIGTDQCLAVASGTEREGVIIDGNTCRDTTHAIAMELALNSRSQIVNNTIEGVDGGPAKVFGMDIRCKDTAGSCEDVVVAGNHVSGLSSSTSDTLVGIKWQLDCSGCKDFTAPVIRDNVMVDLDAMMSVATKPAARDLVSPSIHGNILQGIASAIMLNDLEDEISGNAECEFPDIDNGYRVFADRGCDGVKDPEDAYKGELGTCTIVRDLDDGGDTAMWFVDGTLHSEQDSDGICDNESSP